MISLRTHGTCMLRSGRIQIESDYNPSDGTMGTLHLTLENHENWELVDAVYRLDPCGSVYQLIEFAGANCLVICGDPAIIVVGMDDLSLRSSVHLEFEEGRLTGFPTYIEIPEKRWLVVGSERRVWLYDEGGAIRWMWSCTQSEFYTWITGAPVLEDGCARIPVMDVRDLTRERWVVLLIQDGMPAPP